MRKHFTLFTILFFVVSTLITAQVNVTFKADMRMEINKGTFVPATDKVTVPGGHNNWLNEPPANTTKVMTDADGDGVYELTYSLAPGTYDYKFNIGLGWDGKDEPGDNSKITVGTSPVTITRFFKGKAYTKVNTPVTFSVDMSLPAKQYTNFATTRKVYVAGNFTNWGTSAVQLTHAGNNIFTATITNNDQGNPIKSGDLLIYKFIHSAGTPGEGAWEDIKEGDDYFGGDRNRQYGVVDGTNTVTRFWNNTDPNVQLANGNISFTVDMSVVEELGLFNNANDKLQVRGGFNGWSDSDAPRSKMNQNPLFVNEWFLQVPFTAVQVNSTQQYKFYVELKTPGLWTDGWERPLTMGGGNREIPFKGESNQNAPKVYYDDVYPQFVIPSGQYVQAKFRVNMADAFDPTKIAVPMTTADELYWIAEQPLFVRSLGLEDKDEMTNFKLTDPDGDKIYEGLITVNGPSFNAFEYRYAIKRASDNSWKFEEAGFGKNAYRVRFIDMTGSRKFVQPFTAPLDKWTDKADKSDQVEAWPKGLSTDVEEIDHGIPTQFSLEQNYPNPFNPTTVIQFAIPSDEMVSLKVYNVLGQEVANLVNEQLRAGSYKYNFSASKLSSGVYFYTLKAGNFVESKKMMYLK